MWEWAGNHPFLFFFMVVIVTLATVDVSGNVARVFMHKPTK